MTRSKLGFLMISLCIPVAAIALSACGGDEELCAQMMDKATTCGVTVDPAAACSAEALADFENVMKDGCDYFGGGRSAAFNYVQDGYVHGCLEHPYKTFGSYVWHCMVRDREYDYFFSWCYPNPAIKPNTEVHKYCCDTSAEYKNGNGAYHGKSCSAESTKVTKKSTAASASWWSATTCNNGKGNCMDPNSCTGRGDTVNGKDICKGSFMCCVNDTPFNPAPPSDLTGLRCCSGANCGTCKSTCPGKTVWFAKNHPTCGGLGCCIINPK